MKAVVMIQMIFEINSERKLIEKDQKKKKKCRLHLNTEKKILI